MKILEDISLASKFQQYGVYSALKYLESVLRNLDVPDFTGVPIVAFLEQNITEDGGNLTIAVNLLESEVAIQGSPNSVYLRNHVGVIQYSNDHINWHDVGSGGGGGSGDMLKSTYDADANNIVDKAEALNDGTHSVSAEEAETHLEDTSIHFTEASIDHTNISNVGTNTHAQLDALLIGAHKFLAVVDDPTSDFDTAWIYAKHSASPPYPVVLWTEDNGGNIRKICILDYDGLVNDTLIPAGIMRKTTYDIDADGRVDAAESLNDGTYSVSAETVTNAVTGIPSYSKIFTEIVTPDTPASTKAHLYLYDNSGTQELRLKMDTGDVYTIDLTLVT